MSNSYKSIDGNWDFTETHEGKDGQPVEKNFRLSIASNGAVTTVNPPSSPYQYYGCYQALSGGLVMSLYDDSNDITTLYGFHDQSDELAGEGSACTFSEEPYPVSFKATKVV